MGHPDPIAFTIAGIEIRWYGILIATGMMLAVLISSRRAHTHGITDDDVLDIALWMLPIGVIGARIYYVLFNLNMYHSFAEAVNIRNGGQALALGGFVIPHLEVDALLESGHFLKLSRHLFAVAAHQIESLRD